MPIDGPSCINIPALLDEIPAPLLTLIKKVH